MARIRTIKPTFFTSESVAVLRLRARLTWAGLWTNCDDDGRCKDNVRLIKAAVWPLDDDVSIKEVEEDLQELAQHGRIVRYEIEGARYLQVTNWDEHQKINHKTQSEIPAPPPPDPHGVGLPEDSRRTPGGLPEDSRRNEGLFPEDSLTEGKGEGKGREEEKTRLRAAQPPDRFPEFYEIYPRKTARRKAEQAWSAALKRKADPEQIIDAAKRFRAACHGKDLTFVKHPASWLSAECYLDTPTELRLVSGGYQGWRGPDDQSEYDEEF